MEKLIIEIGTQPSDIVVREGDKILGSILSLKLEADVAKIPPILHVELPDENHVSEEARPGVAQTIEAIQRHGGQVSFIGPPVIESNPEEQTQAESKLRNMIDS